MIIKTEDGTELHVLGFFSDEDNRFRILGHNSDEALFESQTADRVSVLNNDLGNDFAPILNHGTLDDGLYHKALSELSSADIYSLLTDFDFDIYNRLLSLLKIHKD